MTVLEEPLKRVEFVSETDLRVLLEDSHIVAFLWKVMGGQG